MDINAQDKMKNPIHVQRILDSIETLGGSAMKGKVDEARKLISENEKKDKDQREKLKMARDAKKLTETLANRIPFLSQATMVAPNGEKEVRHSHDASLCKPCACAPTPAARALLPAHAPLRSAQRS